MKKKYKIVLILLSILLIGVLFYLNTNQTVIISKGMVTNYNSSQFAATDFEFVGSGANFCSGDSTANKIDNIMGIIRILLFIFGVVCLFIGLPINLRKKSNIKKQEIELNEKIEKETENDFTDEKEELKKIKNKNKCIIVLMIVFGLVSFYIESIITMVLNNYTAHKPIIYLYPESEQKISVSLGNPDKLTCSYPKYIDSWEVFAKPNGDLMDLKTNRNLYALYWEGIKTNKVDFKDGFCVKGEDSAKFLEEKLEILGLSAREAEEFIVYWLPKLENNKYNIIRFETIEEINENMPLQIEPKPDTVIRVMMDFKTSKKYVKLPEQKLTSPERNGFVVVEWGGSEIK